MIAAGCEGDVYYQPSAIKSARRRDDECLAQIHGNARLQESKTTQHTNHRIQARLERLETRQRGKCTSELRSSENYRTQRRGQRFIHETIATSSICATD